MLWQQIPHKSAHVAHFRKPFCSAPFPMCKSAFTRFQYKSPRSYTSPQAPPLPEIPLRGTFFAHEQECSLSIPQKLSPSCASPQAPRTSREPLRRIFFPCDAVCRFPIRIVSSLPRSRAPLPHLAIPANGAGESLVARLGNAFPIFAAL